MMMMMRRCSTAQCRRMTKPVVAFARALSVSGHNNNDNNVPSAAGPWLDGEGRFQNFTDNAFQSVSSDDAASSTFVRNPATQDVIGVVSETTTEELTSMTEKAVIAQARWRTVPVQQRQRVMLRLQHLIRRDQDELAACVTAENGKTLADAAGDVFRGLEVVETAGSAVSVHMRGDALRGLAEAVDAVSVRRPLGVVAGICPFNFPAMIPLWMFPLAVTTGNAMILKPSERTPASACRLALLAAEAGLPPNVLQIAHGGKSTVGHLCTDPSIRAVSFVGSNAAGEWIADTAVSHGKRVQANLGAKNHAVVLPDAPADRAAAAVIGAAFGAGGQRCMAVRFLFSRTTKDIERKRCLCCCSSSGGC